MKTAGIIKIVVGGILLAALISIAAGVLLGRDLWYGMRRAGERVSVPESISATPLPEQAGGAVRQEEAEHGPEGGKAQAPVVKDAGTSVGDARYTAAEIRDIEVQWLAGSVEVRIGESAEIVISETSNETLSDAQRLRSTLQGGKLKIDYCDDIRNIWRWAISGSYNMPAKQLVLELPASLAGTLGELEIDSVSASIQLDKACALSTELETVSGEMRLTGLNCRELSAATTSGDIHILESTANELDVETVSGKTDVQGAFGKLDGSSVSGELTLALTSVPREIETESVSGNVRVTLPQNAEFTAILETVSGDLTSEFAGVMSKDRLVCGSGTNRYEFNSVSGDVRLLAG